MIDTILDSVLDTLKAIPILLLVYLLIEWLQQKIDPQKIAKSKNSIWAPLLGTLAGSVPQCGFSAAYATLYNSGVIGAGTLISVFIATSDEAIPILISRSADFQTIGMLLFFKIVIALAAGYFFTFTIFRREHSTPEPDLICHDDHCHEHHSKSIFLNSVKHTLKTTAFIGVTILAINLVVFFIGEETLEKLLLSQNILQPLITALLGLVPGCATSVLMVELLMNGSISFGAAIAGLSTGAGFGLIILFKGNRNKKNCFLIVACTYLISAIAGMLIQVFFG